MRKLFFLILFACISGMMQAQQINKDLKPFNRIVASPRVHVILQKGDRESIKLVYHDVRESKINIDVNRKTLYIYLDKARKVERHVTYDDRYGSRHGMYDGVSITAYITYKELRSLEIRGNQELTCRDAIESEQFILKAYGENEITLASLKTEYFKASLYGENKLRIQNGKVIEQKYKLYGENRIDTQGLKSAYTTTSIFGEGDLKINSSEEVRVNAFGEPAIYVAGGGQVNKRLIFGKASIYRR
ncbi:MAG: GIN domain-containing protein [Bacteroidota bacterium]